MNSLDQLEEKSIYLIRESYSHYKVRLAMLWSIGKDSTVMLHLTRKAFLGKVPFPLVHVDTSVKIPEMITFRDQTVKRLNKEINLDMIIGQNKVALEKNETFFNGNLTRLQCCQTLKTEALFKTTQGVFPRNRFDRQTESYTKDDKNEIFDALIVGIRSDEEGTRSKERYFSKRSPQQNWDIENLPAELWNQFNTDLHPGESVRVHPILDWSEKNIWQYIEREKIQVTDLYFSNANNERYRSLGCAPCTKPIKSTAKNPTEILHELEFGSLSKLGERSGRSQDQEDQNGLETLRRNGYM